MEQDEFNVTTKDARRTKKKVLITFYIYRRFWCGLNSNSSAATTTTSFWKMATTVKPIQKWISTVPSWDKIEKHINTRREDRGKQSYFTKIPNIEAWEKCMGKLCWKYSITNFYGQFFRFSILQGEQTTKTPELMHRQYMDILNILRFYCFVRIITKWSSKMFGGWGVYWQNWDFGLLFNISHVPSSIISSDKIKSKKSRIIIKTNNLLGHENEMCAKPSIHTRTNLVWTCQRLCFRNLFIFIFLKLL